MEIRKPTVGDENICTKVSKEVKDELDELCREEGFKRAEFVRVAVVENLASYKAREFAKKDGK